MAKSLPRVPDPLLDALIEKLPASGTAWPVTDRCAWLEMMAMAFTLTHGDVGRIAVTSASSVDWSAAEASLRPAVPEQVQVAATRPHHSGYDFYVDKDHFVRRSNPDGLRVLADEAIDQEIYDYRPRGSDGRDHASVIWADGTTGAKPGMTFCGPG